MTPDGTQVYVTNYFDTTVQVIDVATNTIIDTLTVGTAPAGKNVFISPSILIADGGPLQVSNDAELNPLGFRDWVPFNGGVMVLTNHLTSTRQLSVLFNNGQINTNGFDASFKGIDFAAATLSKVGAGALTLNGDGRGEGFLVVDAGRLVLNGANPDASVTLNSSTLSGVGQMSQLAVNNGEVAPGNNGPGMLSAGHASLSAGSTLRIELNGPTAGTGYDRLQVANVATINGATLALQTNFAPAFGAQFLILTNAAGTFAGLPQGTTIISNGVRFRISYTGGDGNDVTLTVDGPPSISVLTDQTVLENHTLGPIDFTVTDDFTSPTGLIVTASSSNTELVANDQIIMAGTGSTRTLTITPAPFVSGVTTITLTVSDGTLTTNRSFLLTVTPAPRYLLSEGATGSFFDTDVIIANPQSAAAPVRIIFTNELGGVIMQDRTLLPMSQTRIKLDEVPGIEDASISTMVISISGVPLVVERTMRWGASGYGALRRRIGTEGAAGRGISPKARRVFSCLLPAARESAHFRRTAAHVTLSDAKAREPILRDYPVRPSSRVTVHAGDDAELMQPSFGARSCSISRAWPSARCISARSALARRALVRGPLRSRRATWFLAEGATGSYFTTYVLLANPNEQPTDVTVRYLPDNGTPVTKVYPLGAQQRLTLNIAVEDATLANAGSRDGSDGDTSDRRRARAASAGQHVGRSARQRGRHLDGHSVGAGRRSGGRHAESPDLHPAGESWRDSTSVVRDVPAPDGRDHHPLLRRAWRRRAGTCRSRARRAPCRS